MGTSSILVIVTGASGAGTDGITPKTADTSALADRILSVSSRNVLFAHPLFGPDDLLVGVSGDTMEEAFTILTAIRGAASDRHSYVSGTKSHVVVESFGRPLERDAWIERQSIGAWIMMKIGRPTPDDHLPRLMLENPAIKFVAPVYGEFDVFAFAEAPSVEKLEAVIDDYVRPLRQISSTDTRITFHKRGRG